MNRKALTPALMIDYAETLAAHLPAQIGYAKSLQEARDTYEGCGYVFEGLKEEGYSALLIEVLQVRCKKAMAEAVTRFDAEAPKTAPMGANRHGLDMGYFLRKLTNMKTLMHSYTPDEFARECCRMARTASENVLREEEFL